MDRFLNLFSIIDFLAYLIPGALTLFGIKELCYPNIEMKWATTYLVIIYVVGSFALGLVLEAFGDLVRRGMQKIGRSPYGYLFLEEGFPEDNFLFKVLFVKRITFKANELKKIQKALSKRYNLQNKGSLTIKEMQHMYMLSKMAVRAHCPEMGKYGDRELGGSVMCLSLTMAILPLALSWIINSSTGYYGASTLSFITKMITPLLPITPIIVTLFAITKIIIILFICLMLFRQFQCYDRNQALTFLYGILMLGKNDPKVSEKD
jgi:hypothetical protein